MIKPTVLLQLRSALVSVQYDKSPCRLDEENLVHKLPIRRTERLRSDWADIHADQSFSFADSHRLLTHSMAHVYVIKSV